MPRSDNMVALELITHHLHYTGREAPQYSMRILTIPLVRKAARANEESVCHRRGSWFGNEVCPATIRRFLLDPRRGGVGRATPA